MEGREPAYFDHEPGIREFIKTNPDVRPYLENHASRGRDSRDYRD